MGLLSHIESLQHAVSASMDVSKTPVTAGRFSLRVFARQYRLTHLALFSLQGTLLSITDGIGIDAQSVIRSISTNDFWTGTVRGTGWHRYAKTDAGAFAQFFSEALFDRVESVSFLRIGADILAVLQCGDDSVPLPPPQTVMELLTQQMPAIPVIPATLPTAGAALLLITVKQIIERIICTTPATVLNIEPHLSTLVHTVLLQAFPAPNAVINVGNGEYKAVLFSERTIDETLLRFHLIRALAPIFGDDAAQLLIVLPAGIETTAHGIRAFLEDSHA